MAQIYVELVSTAPLPVRTEADDGLATLTCSASGPSGSWSATVSTSSTLAWEVLARLATWADLVAQDQADALAASAVQDPHGAQGQARAQDPAAARLLDLTAPVEGGFSLQLVSDPAGLSVLAVSAPATPRLGPVTQVPVTLTDLRALAEALTGPGQDSRYRFCRLGSVGQEPPTPEPQSAPLLTCNREAVTGVVDGLPVRYPLPLVAGWLETLVDALGEWSRREPGTLDGQSQTLLPPDGQDGLVLQLRGAGSEGSPLECASVRLLLSHRRTTPAGPQRVPLWYCWARPEDLARTVAGWDGATLTVWAAAGPALPV